MRTYVDVYLKFADEDEFRDEMAFLFSEEGELQIPENCAIDLVGPVVTTDAVYDDEGELVTDAVIDNAYHVNIRATEEFVEEHIPEDYRVTPDHPRRVWA